MLRLMCSIGRGRGGGSASFADMGLIYLIKRTLTVDATADFGLSGTETDNFSNIGLGKRGLRSYSNRETGSGGFGQSTLSIRQAGDIKRPAARLHSFGSFLSYL